LGEILKKIFSCDIKKQDNLGFLGRQTVDYSVRDLQLGFEYDGEHHFGPVRFNGIDIERADANYQLQQERDKRKEKLCRKNGYRLIRIGYFEELTVKRVKEIMEKY
jgi:very-short-patch-repair endonuclease